MDNDLYGGYGKTKILYDTFVCDPMPVNRFIYRSWLEGLTDKETASRRDSIEKTVINTANITGVGGGGSNLNNNTGLAMVNSNGTPLQQATFQQLLEETEDQFRNFTLLSSVLEHPRTLSTHSMFQMDPLSRKLLIEGYYDFDDIFMRELIGRKMTSGQRRDLDDTSEKLKIRLSTCERQFDNLKRISRIVFANIKSPPIDIIMSEFSLSRDLAKKYVKILFLCLHRFDLSHKRVQLLNTQDLMRLAEIVMNNWGDPLKSYPMELDLKLKEDVRDLKVYLSKEIPEKYWKMVKYRYQTMGQSPKIVPSPLTHSSTSLPTQTPPLLPISSTNTSTGSISLPPSTSSTPMTSSSSNLQTLSNISPAPPSSTTTTTTSTTNTTSTTTTIGSSGALPPLHGPPVPPLPISTFALSQQLTYIFGDKLRALENKFKSIIKGILAIGSNLSDSKELRNLFEDIVEKIIDPLKRIDMTSQEVDTLFVFLRELFVPESLGLSASIRHKDRVVHNWRSFLEGLRAIVTYLYDKFN